MNRDFQSAFELYVEGNGTSKRPRTRSTSSLPLFKEQYQDSMKGDIDIVSRNQFNKSSGHHKSRSFCMSNLSQLIHKKLSPRRKSVGSTGSCMSYRNKPPVTDGNSDEIIRKQSFKESSGIAGESWKRNECDNCVTESKTKSLDCLAAKFLKRDPVSSGIDEAVGTGGSCASVNHLSQHSRLVVKITQKKFCQLKCIDMEPQNRDSEEKPVVVNSDSERWLRKSRLRTEVKMKLVRKQSSKYKVIDKSWSSPHRKRTVQSKVMKSKLTTHCEGKQCKTVKKSLKSAYKEKTVSSDAVTKTDCQVEQRPRRNIIPKKLSDTSGLSWKEETDLKKALYASLQKQRSSKVELGTRGVAPDGRPDKISAIDEILQRQTVDSKLKTEQQAPGKSTVGWSGPIGSKKRNSQPVQANDRLSTRSSSSRQSDCSALWANKSCDWTDGSCHKTEVLCTSLAYDKRIESASQVRAQRKFAHSSGPGTPALALRRRVNQNSPRKDCKLRTVATEDFLTFLCLRGTDCLPPHLELFNYSESESLQSFPNTPHESPDASQPDTPSPDPPVHLLQEPGSSSTSASRQQADVKKLSQACHSLRVGSAAPPLSSAISGCHSQLSQATLKKSQTEPSSLQQVNGIMDSKTLSPFPSVVKQFHLKDSEKGRKVKRAVESKLQAKRKKVDLSFVQAGGSTTDSGPSESLENRSQNLSASRGKECIPDFSPNLTACEKDRPQSQMPSEQGVSCLDATENRSRPTTRSRTAALMQKQLTMAQMWDKSDLHQEPKEESKDEIATCEDVVKKQMGFSSAASSSDQKKHLNSVNTDCLIKGFQKQSVMSGKSSKESSRSGSIFRHLTRKRSCSNGRVLGEALSGLPNEQERRSFLPNSKRRKITGCKSHSWKKLRLLRSTSSLSSCKQGSISSKETLNEIHNDSESGGDKIIPATFKNKSKQCQGVAGEIAAVPTYHPSTEQFQDPVRYIESVSLHAIPYGLCQIIPPEGWEVECCLSDDLSFSTEVNCLNRFLDKSYMKIKMMIRRLEKKFSTIGNWRAEVVDGKALIEAVDNHGGFEIVQSQDSWTTIGSLLGIEDVRVLSCLPDLYCLQYLESCGITMSQAEEPSCTDATEESVNKETRESYVIGAPQLNSQVRSRTLKDFHSFAKAFESSLDTMAEQAPTSCEIEKMFWDLMGKNGSQMEVETACIDTKQCGSAFPSKNDVPYSKHEWNFNVLQHNPNSVLNYLGSISNVTVPVLQIGMRFSSSFWSHDQHHLPFIHYLHTGNDVIWYCVRASDAGKLRTVLADVYPGFFIPTNPLALFETPVMVSPETLALHGISMSRAVQKRGQFIVVFPESIVCNISCGYNIAEMLHLATPDWIPVGYRAAELLHLARWPELFSMDHLLLQMAKSSTDLMTEDAARILLTCLGNELQQRNEVFQLGLKCFEAIPTRRLNRVHRVRQTTRYHIIQDEEKRCIMCSRICYISMLVDEKHDLVFCLKHGIQYLKERQCASFSKLLYRFDEKTLTGMIMKLRAQLEDRCNRKSIGTDIKRQQKLAKKLNYCSK